MNLPNGLKLNPGIKNTVRWLNDNGFDTCDSGDGATHDFGCDRVVGYVVCPVSPGWLIEGADELRRLVLSRGVEVTEQNEEGTAVCIQATYCPASKTAFLDLSGVSDAGLGL